MMITIAYIPKNVKTSLNMKMIVVMIGPRVSVVFSETKSLVKLKSVMNPVSTVALRSYFAICSKKACTY